MRTSARVAAFFVPLAVAIPLFAVPLYDAGLRFTDDGGKPVELAAFRGKNVVLTMFYTNCTTKCPMTLRKLREIEKTFADRKEAVEFVLVSFDSKNDSPAALARFRKREKLDAGRWHLLTGESAPVRALAERIGLGGYLDLGDHMVHRYRIVRLSEDGSVRAAIDWEHPDVAGLFASM